jgi:hypothetical protein
MSATNTPNAKNACNQRIPKDFKVIAAILKDKQRCQPFSFHDLYPVLQNSKNWTIFIKY